MALTGAYISFREIIERVYMDNQYRFEVPTADMATWIAACLNLIGYVDQYEAKVTGFKEHTPFDITNYRGELPCGVYKVRQVAVDGVVAFPSNNSFHHLLDGKCCGLDDLSTTINGDIFVDNFGNSFNTALGTRHRSVPMTYTLNDNFITLSEKIGKVCLSYWGLKVDDEGYPMIPDNESYKELVKWYLTHKLDYIGWRDGSVRREVFEYTEQQYLWYAGQSSNAAKMPGEAEMEGLKNQLLRTLPQINDFSSFSKFSQVPEQRRLT
jgi:hypothetical protein